MAVVSDIFTRHRKTHWSQQNSPTFISENIIKRLKETFLTSGWNKTTITSHISLFIVTHAFGLPFVPVAMPSKTTVQMEESNLLWQCPGSSPGQILPKTYNTCKKPYALQTLQVMSKPINSSESGRKCERLTQTTWTAMAIAHMKFGI